MNKRIFPDRCGDGGAVRRPPNRLRTPRRYPAAAIATAVNATIEEIQERARCSYGRPAATLAALRLQRCRCLLTGNRLMHRMVCTYTDTFIAPRSYQFPKNAGRRAAALE
jgi:hypothetical protein